MVHVAEAVRELLRTMARSINGTPPSNGTGGLDIEKPLLADLPEANSLRRAPPTRTNGA
jgi:hypothetical protein